MVFKKGKENINSDGKYTKGRIPSKKTREIWSKQRKGKGNGFYGKKHSEEFKNKLSQERKGKHYSPNTEFKKGITCGSNHPSWKGGISKNPYPAAFNIELKTAIRKRDKYICFICNKKGSIVVHHINYNKNDCHPENLITLCKSCHHKTNYNRNKWEKYFKENIKCA